ncbi:hypothetical protein [Actinocrispum wychmicini]|nr:hypothetical protein [Actinocrispum wychmicini]
MSTHMLRGGSGHPWCACRPSRIRRSELSGPALYQWLRASTVPETADYLRRHSLVEHELAVGHHWPWILDPDLVARIISRFVHAR